MFGHRAEFANDPIDDRAGDSRHVAGRSDIEREQSVLLCRCARHASFSKACALEASRLPKSAQSPTRAGLSWFSDRSNS